MPLTTDELIILLEKSLKYTPIVYKQSLFSTNQEAFDNKYILEFKYTNLPDDSLLFFVPALSSIQPTSETKCVLEIRIPTVNQEYNSVTYDIIIEQNTGVPRPAGLGDIIANRLCIFRFRKSMRQVVLCNSPLFNDAVYSNLKVTNAEFLNAPVVDDPNNPGLTYTVITTKELKQINDRIDELENKIRFGTGDPEEELADAPAGTIYIQHEAD